MGKSDDDDNYEADLEKLQIALVRWQVWAMENHQKTLIVFEGRDAAGKGGTIKRIIEFLSPRDTRAVALPKPSDAEKKQWYFQRYVPHLPSAGNFVLFNRSWYNRGGVEPVMEFCTPEQAKEFLNAAPHFEEMLVDSGIQLIKFWLDISKDEQAGRLEERRTDPLKTLKTSPLDAEAQKRWDAYSEARNGMLTQTHSKFAPWTVVLADKKKPARLAVIRHILRTFAPKEITKGIEAPDKDILFTFTPKAIKDGRLAK